MPGNLPGPAPSGLRRPGRATAPTLPADGSADTGLGRPGRPAPGGRASVPEAPSARRRGGAGVLAAPRGPVPGENASAFHPAVSGPLGGAATRAGTGPVRRPIRGQALVRDRTVRLPCRARRVTPGVPTKRRSEKSMGNEGGAAAPSLVSLFLLKTENARLYDVDFYSMEGRRDALPSGSARSAPPCRRRPPEEAGRSRTRRGGTAPRRPLSAVPSPASAPVRGDDGGRH